MFTILLAFAIASEAPSTPDVSSANSWVGLVDSKRWNESWAAAGSLFKARMPEASWASTIQPVREPLGAVSSRSLKSITRSTSLPGAPDGEYEVLQFETSFANKAAATETVVLSHEQSGWKVDGYFIR
ncbi:MAG TPA: DUF4019 domain-containing protein [Sphingomicrobium sp.]|nr:DUF4019 domain-containing protein [Sphingomicrobium sp.]